MNKYKNFSLEEFLQDEFFRKSIQDPFSKEAEVLEKWLQNHSEMRPVVDEASRILLALQPCTVDLPDDFYQRIKNRIDHSINSETKKTAKISFFSHWLQLVAVVAGLVIGATLLVYSLSDTTTMTKYSSAYGQTKEVSLPDGSTVVLNAKSSVEYHSHHRNKVREVWLIGEGFFKIRHLEDSKKQAIPFIVHSNQLNIEVLGTQFNVNTYDTAKTMVLLTKGKVRLSVEDGGLQPEIMKPGELALYSQRDTGFSINKVSAGSYLSWMKHRYLFEKMTLGDISKVIGRYYGKQVVIRDVNLERKKMSGALEMQDENTLIQTLSTLLGVHVDNNNDQISIGSE